MTISRGQTVGQGAFLRKQMLDIDEAPVALVHS